MGQPASKQASVNMASFRVYTLTVIIVPLLHMPITQVLHYQITLVNGVVIPGCYILPETLMTTRVSGYSA